MSRVWEIQNIHFGVCVCVGGCSGVQQKSCWNGFRIGVTAVPTGTQLKRSESYGPGQPNFQVEYQLLAAYIARKLHLTH